MNPIVCKMQINRGWTKLSILTLHDSKKTNKQNQRNGNNWAFFVDRRRLDVWNFIYFSFLRSTRGHPVNFEKRKEVDLTSYNFPHSWRALSHKKMPPSFFKNIFSCYFVNLIFPFSHTRTSFSLKWLFNWGEKKERKKEEKREKILLNFTSVLLNVTFYHFISRYALLGYRKICFRIYHRLCSPLHRWTLICQFFLTFFFSLVNFSHPSSTISCTLLPSPLLAKRIAFYSTKVSRYFHLCIWSSGEG